MKPRKRRTASQPVSGKLGSVEGHSVCCRGRFGTLEPALNPFLAAALLPLNMIFRAFVASLSELGIVGAGKSPNTSTQFHS